jgi:hypothetical protein
MSFSDAVEKASQSLIGWAVVSFSGGLFWLIRRVFTNQKQIELMQQEAKARDQLRQRDREDLHEVKADVKEMTRDMKRLFQNHGD